MLGAALIPPILTISLFVLAATTALAVNLRRPRYARLRMVGATRGQIRRSVLAVCGVAGGALGWLGRVGATRGQAAAVFVWHALFVTVTGLIAGMAAGAVTLLAVTRAATGSWVPFVPFGPAAGLAGAVAALTLAAVVIPFLAMARREPTIAAG